MKNFMDSDFLLQTDTAKMLYHDAAETMPIFDYHNHLNQKAILEDSQMDNLTQVCWAETITNGAQCVQWVFRKN